jgi:peptide/nickel transport system permease protein
MSTPPLEKPVERLLDIGVHMVLPLFSWIASGFFIKCIQSSALFSIFSLEGYVVVARAKGVSPRELEMNYILRPAFPPVLTSFSLMMLDSWNGSVILETVFGWNGLSSLTTEAIF